MAYDLAHPELDARVAALVADASGNANQDLIRELVTTALKLHRDAPERGELKLINTALKEMRYTNLVFSRHRDEPKVTVFGSARAADDDPNYLLATEFGRRMAEVGWDVVTGAGPGVMEAANRGAGLDRSFGVNIRLPFEDGANPYIAPERTINFKYFFTRKLGFVKEAHAFALFPGGFGTLDEAFELLTLMQTGKSDLHPIVLVEAPGTDYWGPWTAFVDDQLVGQGLISPDDRSLYRVVADLDAAVEELVGFYRVYHSQRFVDGRLVLRLNRDVPDDVVDGLDTDFADILIAGGVERVSASEREVAEDDCPDLPRLALPFDRRHFGRLRQLVDRLNASAPASASGMPGEAFPDHEADRSW